ncbi:MAG: peptidase [Pseudomonadales bacterium]|nr:peptidase [Pseudomonadales bacterium]
MKKLLSILALSFFSMASLAETDTQKVIKQYSDIAHAVFEDALIAAEKLDAEIDNFLQAPTAEGLEKTRNAWKAARAPYLQSEVFRFGNPVVDDWEGELNAWPLDEGLIDYVSAGYNHEMGNIGATANIIANRTLTIGGDSIDLTEITPELLSDLNELGGSEANVATGYHAIEFLLWGQDLNGTDAGAGNRPYTDFVTGEQCTHGNCDRRIAYLKSATRLLIENLQYMTEQWQENKPDNYRHQLFSEDENTVLTKILFGMGSLSLGELAGERMKVALEANSPEDEQDCFSDNTHNAHFYDAKGIRNVYEGNYRRINGELIQGFSIDDLIQAKNPGLHQKLSMAFENTEQKLQVMVDSAESGEMAFDQMIAEGNEKGYKIISDAITALVDQTRLIEQLAQNIGIEKLEPDAADHSF